MNLASVTVDGRAVRYEIAFAVPSLPPALSAQMRLGIPGAAADFGPLLGAVTGKVRVTVNGVACATDRGRVAPPAKEGDAVRVTVDYACAAAPGVLAIRDDLFDVLGDNFHTVALIVWPGGSRQFMFQPDLREARLELSASTAASGTSSFFLLGVEHILIGWDHLLFLMCLLLLGGSFWNLLKIITAFTIAHSITLAAAALELVTLPSRLVESTIALSIAYVAAENVLLRDKAASKRWLVAFVFGLVHGFGFSSVLKEIGLPTQGLVWALLGFNLGVEAGQATVVAIAMPMLIWLRRRPWEPRAVTTVSAIVLAVGLGLFLERAFF
ncbi:MAG TPA: HupE/UreJ family protein [Burkholderiales bacterium]|nr:HupE/UreJ family protein [Burkholderiales bacterium]